MNPKFQDAYGYNVVKKTTLAAAAEVVTIQQPATGAFNVHFHSVGVDAVDVDVEFTIERDGTAATATTLAVAGQIINTPAAKCKAWSGSDAGVGTVLERHTVPTGAYREFDLSGYWLLGEGTAKNLTIRTTSMTGTVIITFKLGENPQG